MTAAIVLDRELTLREVLGEEWSEEVFASIGEQIARWLDDVEDKQFYEIDIELDAEVECGAIACKSFWLRWNGGDGWLDQRWCDIEDEEIEIDSVAIRTYDGTIYNFNREEVDKVTREANRRL